MKPQLPESILTQHVTADQLIESAFSDTHPDVRAVGEEVFADFNGTSFSAPQVAGLAAYLWQLSSDLLAKRAAVTKQAIVANARNRVIDAYASVLSLDAAALPTPANSPIRRQVLDIDGDGRFTDFDLDAYLRRFYFVAPNTNDITYAARPAVPADFSRFDLNGDGFTTAGARRDRFDLDRVGSTQYGRTVYSVVTQNIEDAEVRFDEEAPISRSFATTRTLRCTRGIRRSAKSCWRADAAYRSSRVRSRSILDRRSNSRRACRTTAE